MNKVDWIERLIVAAYVKGLHLRGLKGIRQSDVDEIKNIVEYACENLDALGVSWSIQNKALAFINDIDDQKVWQQLFKRSHKQIAQGILSQS